MKKKTKSGATLIEVMLAVLILAIMATALPIALQQPRRLVVQSLQRQVCVLAGTEALEMASSWNPDDLSDGWETAAEALSSRYGLNDQNVTIEAEAEVSEDHEDMTTVSVRITYPGGGGDEVYLETLLYTP